jgi:maltose O-acetyltransferase
MRLMLSVLLNPLYSLLERIRHFRYRARIQDLVARGLVIGDNVTISPTAYIDYGYPYLIRIGDNSSLANDVRLLAHDATPFKFTDGYTRLGKIEVKENCFIGERTIILPGVTIGPNVLVAAGSLINRDIPPNSCVAGVPARVYAKFDSLIERHREQIGERAVFQYADLHNNVDQRLRDQIWEAVQGGDAYVQGYLGNYPYTLNDLGNGK